MYSIKLYTSGMTLSSWCSQNFGILFDAYDATPNYIPYIFVALDMDGKEVGALFGVSRRCLRWFPPFIFYKGIMLGEGIYSDIAVNRERMFQELLNEVTRCMMSQCLILEFRNIHNGRFAYKLFREQSFFPVHWLDVYNSLHSRKPEERLFERIRRRIGKSLHEGVTFSEAVTPEDKIGRAHV